MSTLCIIPAAAVADHDLSDTQVRVLCAIGTFTNRLGGNVWASVKTLAAGSNLSERTVQRCLPALMERGYLRMEPRVGRTNLYEIVLDRAPEGVTPVSGGGDTADGGGVTTQSPKRYKERYNITNTAKQPKVVSNPHPALSDVVDAIWAVYPQRLMPHPFIPFRAAVSTLLSAGVQPDNLYRSAQRYAESVLRERTEPKFVKSLHGFFTDDYWRAYDVTLVEGRTREEWARSGQDVAEFDRLSLSYTGEPHVA
jgi:hypothetical protein